MDNEIFDTKLSLINLNLHYFSVFTLIIYKILGSIYNYLAICQILPNFAMQKTRFRTCRCTTCRSTTFSVENVSAARTYGKKALLCARF